MTMNSIQSLPLRLSGNPYPGRGIAIGSTPDGLRAVVVYFIMGRSANSRNRIFVEEAGSVFARAFDESKVEDPSLIHYAPVRVYSSQDDYALIVTNGDQTDTIYGALERGETFEQALSTRSYEPDAPNYTPRISGLLAAEDDGWRYRLSILKRVEGQGERPHRFFYHYPLCAGIGHFVSTYVTDGTPLPSFEGEPVPIEIPDDIDAFTEQIWSSLDEQNKISLYVRCIDLETKQSFGRVINRHA